MLARDAGDRLTRCYWCGKEIVLRQTKDLDTGHLDEGQWCLAIFQNTTDGEVMVLAGTITCEPCQRLPRKHASTPPVDDVALLNAWLDEPTIEQQPGQ